MWRVVLVPLYKTYIQQHICRALTNDLVCSTGIDGAELMNESSKASSSIEGLSVSRWALISRPGTRALSLALHSPLQTHPLVHPILLMSDMGEARAGLAQLAAPYWVTSVTPCFSCPSSQHWRPTLLERHTVRGIESTQCLQPHASHLAFNSDFSLKMSFWELTVTRQWNYGWYQEDLTNSRTLDCSTAPHTGGCYEMSSFNKWKAAGSRHILFQCQCVHSVSNRIQDISSATVMRISTLNCTEPMSFS